VRFYFCLPAGSKTRLAPCCGLVRRVKGEQVFQGSYALIDVRGQAGQSEESLGMGGVLPQAFAEDGESGMLLPGAGELDGLDEGFRIG
jgi:hypothetical protein